MLQLYLLLTAGALGAMIFFAAIVAPAAFRVLAPDAAGRLMRHLFPVYYLAFAGVTGLAAALAIARGDGIMAGALFAVALGFVFARQIMVPRINALRDVGQAGDTAAARGFERWHRGSVVLNLAQMGVLLVAVLSPL